MRMKLAAAATAGFCLFLLEASQGHAQSSARCGNFYTQVNAAVTRQDRVALERLLGLPAAQQCGAEAQTARSALARLAPPPPPPAVSPPPPVASPPLSPPPPPSAPAADEVAWRNAQRTNSCDGYRGFLSLFSDSRFAAQARRERDRLCAPPPSPPAATAARTSPPPPPAATAAPAFLDARTTPSSTRAPLVRDPASLPDFALFRECEGCPEMVVLPGGSFLMGSPAGEAGREENEDTVSGAGGGQVRVSIGRFAIARFETTWEEWEACVGAGVCQQGPVDADNGWGRGRRPVIAVDWNDAGVFARWVNGRASVSAYRRPTEAEWEYAARAGTTTRWSFGDQESQLGAHAWFRSNSGDRTQSVGGKAANPFGLYDLHGNVWEWVEDCWRDNLSGRTAAAYTTGSCSLRVLRGGSWDDIPRYLRSAVRFRLIPSSRGLNVGFRLARTL